jgi:hypothetical protein
MKFVLVVVALFLVGCSKTDEELWVEEQKKVCFGLGGDRFSYVENTATAYCSRKPFLRASKTLFKTRYPLRIE